MADGSSCCCHVSCHSQATVIGSVFGCLSGWVEVPDRGSLRHKIAAQEVDALSDECNNWLYDMSALIFYFYHMEIEAGRELTALEEWIEFRLSGGPWKLALNRAKSWYL